MRYTSLEEDMEGNLFLEEHLLESSLVTFALRLILQQKLACSIFELEHLLNNFFKFQCQVQLLAEDIYVITFTTQDGEQQIIEVTFNTINLKNL